MVNYPLFPPQGEDVVGFARTWWHLRQACAGNGVLVDSNDPNGMKVTRASASSVNVAAGHYANKGIWKAYAGASPAIESIPAASAGYHRYDAICVKLSDNTIVRVSGTEAVPDDVDDFLENFTPLPPDWNSTDYIELAIICVDENGIRSGDNGTYSTGGVADTRTPVMFGLDNSTLQISADGKLESSGGSGDGFTKLQVTVTHADGANTSLGTCPAFCILVYAAVSCGETWNGSSPTIDIGTSGDPDAIFANAEIGMTSGNKKTRFHPLGDDGIESATEYFADVVPDGSTEGETTITLLFASFV